MNSLAHVDTERQALAHLAMSEIDPGGVGSIPLSFTLFRSLAADNAELQECTFDELIEKLRGAKSYKSKSDCPLIKLATFGEERTEKNSLRHDRNLLEIFGIEGDYDGEAVTLSEAEQMLYENGIAAVLYTSPSHTPAKPRWRVLVPLSRPYPPADRTRLLGRLNGALAGILAPESFALSQCYYVGHVEGVKYEVAQVRGTCIDLLDELDARAIGAPKNGENRAGRMEKVRAGDAVLARLAEQDMVLRNRPDGGADIVCPFEAEHTTPRAPGDCSYFLAHTGGFKRAHFKCLHGHCAGRSDADFARALGLVDGEARAPEESEQGTPSAGNASAGAVAAQEWQQPLPLLAKIAPEPYPLNALPDTIRAAVEEVQAFVKAPASLVAASALGALSVAAQAIQDVKRAEKLQGPSGLFLLTIADSGERKTTCDGFFTEAIRDYEQHQAESAKPDLARYAAAIAAWEAKRDGILTAIKQAAKTGKPVYGKPIEALRSELVELDNAKPQAPRVPSLLRGDDTSENLAWVLAHKWPSAGVISSEAGIVLGAHSMGKDSIMRNLALLNLLWDGGTLKIGRRTSDSFTVRGARLTVALQVQEATLRSFFDRSDGLARGTGFLSRFLVAWPESTQGARSFSEAPATWPALAAFHRRIRALLDAPTPIDADGALSPAIIALTAEAKSAWVDFHDAIEAELRSGGELYDVRDVAAKAADNAARLAALFQALENDTGGAVGLEAFKGAGRIVAWHLSEARRFFEELALPVELANAARLDSWLVEYCRREHTHIVPRRDIQRNVTPARLREKAALSEALRELAEAGHVRETSEGRRKDIFLNPALLLQVDA